MVFSVLLAFAAINLRADQTIGGTALNIFAPAFAVVITWYFYLTTPVAVVLFIIAWLLMYKTRFGLRLRACGEHPQAADSVGINVYKMRYAGVLISGFLGGVGGIAYTIAVGSGFSASVGGYGFLALAVMIFGNWKPFQILGSAFFFALFKLSRSSDPHFSSRCSRSLQPIIPRFLSCRSSKE